MSPQVDPQVANFNPTGFALENQQRQANLATTQQEQGLRAQDISLRQQQVQGAQLQNQITQRQLRDSQIIEQAYADYDPKSPTADADMDRKLLSSGISAPGFFGFQNQRIAMQKGLQGLDEGRLKIEDNLNEKTSDALQSYKAIPDAQKPQIWAQMTAPALQRLHPEARLDPTNPLVGTALDAYIGLVTHHAALTKDALEKQQTAKAAEETKGEEQKTELTKREIALHDQLVNTPGGLERYVSGSIDPNQFPQEYKAAVNEARMTANIKDLDAVVARHSENVSHQVSQKALETDPQIMATRRKLAEDEANHQDALRRNDEADKQYYESSVDFNTTKASAQSIQKVVELAQSGNPAAAQQLKALMPEFTNAMMSIKRLGGGQNDKNFTSAFDTAMDTADSIFHGQPFTPSTLNQVMPYIKTITNGAAQKHNAIVDTVNQTYKKNYQHESVPYQDIANPKAPPKQGDSQTYQGRKYVFNGTKWIGQ